MDVTKEFSLEELAQADFPLDVGTWAMQKLRIRKSCAKLEASPASDPWKSPAPQSTLSRGC